ncbi:MAG: rimI [Francisellaceae bacterium]|nr:rimI [Francisellaceae bacterium]
MITIRDMQARDIPKVIIIEQLSNECPWTQTIFEDCLKVGYDAWVVLKNEELVGFALMSRAVGEAHVLNLKIHPNFQGQGLGKALMKECIKLAKMNEIKYIFLEVRLSNKSAQELYKKLSFEEIGLRREYYETKTGREDALILRLNLNNH